MSASSTPDTTLLPSVCALENAACFNPRITVKHQGKCLTPQFAAVEAEEEEEEEERECPER